MKSSFRRPLMAEVADFFVCGPCGMTRKSRFSAAERGSRLALHRRNNARPSPGEDESPMILFIRRRMRMLASLAFAWHGLAMTVMPLCQCCVTPDSMKLTTTSKSSAAESSSAVNCPMHEDGSHLSTGSHDSQTVPVCACATISGRCGPMGTEFIVLLGQEGILPQSLTGQISMSVTGLAPESAPSAIRLAVVPPSPPPRA
jgi:hypothetical protein